MPAPAVDFTLLELEPASPLAWNRRAMIWLGGMLLLVAVSIAGLALFLRSVEAEDANRRRVADAQWLDQTLRFHFRRLEGDLMARARQSQQGSEAANSQADPAVLKAGQLWRTAGVILFHAWMPAARQADVAHWPAEMRAAARDPEAAQALRAMLATTDALQRPAYAGPLPQNGARGRHTLWVAVPQFDQGRFVGDHVAAVQFEQALASIIPPWFSQDHDIQLHPEWGTNTPSPRSDDGATSVPIHLPGIQLSLDVRALAPQVALAPRLFFGVALLCLLAMVAALYALWRDTSRRQRAEAQLQTQRVLRQAMEQAVMLGLRAWDTQGRLLYVNQAFCRLVGWQAEDLLHTTGPMPYWPGEPGGEVTQLKAHLADATAQQIGVEMQWRHRDGHLLDVIVHAAPLSLPDGTVVGWMDSALDLTERKRIERRAARQQEMLEASGRLIAVGEVASTLAHELNQPLGALSSFANGLLNRVQQQSITLDEVRPVVERMARIADKAGRVIQRVNAFARRQDMNRQPLDLVPFVGRVVGQLPVPEGLRLHWHVTDEDDALSVPADALLLEHALHNVVLNATEWARKTTEESPRVEVRLRHAEGMVGIQVADNGPGVPEDQVHTIFDAFASGKDGGMGMGLSICRSIIEAHRGRIDVARSDELHGAQFTLWLPLNP